MLRPKPTGLRQSYKYPTRLRKHAVNANLRNENEWREVCTMMLLGYARVSTSEQDTSAQVSALKSAGCEKIFRENASGGRWDRPELHRLLDQMRKGDVLIVSRLDRKRSANRIYQN